LPNATFAAWARQEHGATREQATAKKMAAKTTAAERRDERDHDAQAAHCHRTSTASVRID